MHRTKRPGCKRSNQGNRSGVHLDIARLARAGIHRIAAPAADEVGAAAFWLQSKRARLEVHAKNKVSAARILARMSKRAYSHARQNASV